MMSRFVFFPAFRVVDFVPVIGAYLCTYVYGRHSGAAIGSLEGPHVKNIYSIGNILGYTNPKSPIMNDGYMIDYD